MTGEASNPKSPPHKAYNMTNLKTYVPLILDLTTYNYELWSTISKAHCITYDVLNHIDDTYDLPNKTPTDTEWEQLESMVILWLFGSISQNIIISAHSPQATARKVWLNIHALFYENKESTAMQLETEIRNVFMCDLTVHEG